MLTNGQKSLINSLLSEYYDETKDVKEKEFTKNLMEVLNWPPSTVESPFSKEMIEQIISDVEDIRKVVGYSDTRDKIISTCNHLLTNANEWPKEMLVGDHESSLKPCNVIYADPMNRFFVTKDEGDSDYYTWKICRPIEQKPKELKDLVKGDKVWCNKTVWFKGGSKYGECFTSLFQYEVVGNRLDNITLFDNSGENHSMDYDWFNKHFQLTPPTSEQFTAAEEAAINEVKQRFDKARREEWNG